MNLIQVRSRIALACMVWLLSSLWKRQRGNEYDIKCSESEFACIVLRKVVVKAEHVAHPISSEYYGLDSETSLESILTFPFYYSDGLVDGRWRDRFDAVSNNSYTFREQDGGSSHCLFSV
eukprot:840896_1